LGNRQNEIEEELLNILEHMENLELEKEEILQGEEND
jgi:hypothetical protein